LVFNYALQQKIAKEKQTWGGSTTVKKQVSGTASSVAFTPLQVCYLIFSYLIFSYLILSYLI
jgi:hypothetical protein